MGEFVRIGSRKELPKPGQAKEFDVRGKLVCPWHGWEFDPLTGAAVHNHQNRVAVYAVRVEGDDVLVDLSGR
jgi:nitrite reductase/ring-hydroxylating ferredoxin subunit